MKRKITLPTVIREEPAMLLRCVIRAAERGFILRYLFLILFINLFGSVCSIYTQEEANRKYYPEYPLLFRPTNHDPNFTSFPKVSFYQSRNDWQAIIDSTWGPGLPLAAKVVIFDQFATALQNQFDGFLSLGMDQAAWDSLKIHYRSQIDSTTSRGGFSAIMNRLAKALRDAHTHAVDSSVVFTPLNPGVPLLMLSGYLTIEHFGAVLTALPDSSLLVLRAVANHPLGLQAGDIILGYEGVAWKVLLHELLDAGLPFIPNGIGAASAYSDFLLLGAGMNWHLFGTMDIIEYATGDTLHLPVAPMINLNIPPMLNNEQVEIPGIPFPDFFNGQIVSYGIINNTNVGYIYLFQEWPPTQADEQFAQAVNALKNTDGLIIDMRLNFGGWAFFDEAFDILFNEFNFTVEDAYRISSTFFLLAPSNNAPVFEINPDPNTLYGHPIAVLLGPTCISMGDITAQRFHYHPTARFFGKPPGASMGDNSFISGISDWSIRYSISDMFHVSQPGNYLNRAEFPIDFPVWHNPDDAANGIDAVVEAALNWINSATYAYNVKPGSLFIRPLQDTLTITANVSNPYNHNLSVAAIINTPDTVLVDSLPMFDDGNHGDSLAGDGLYGCFLNPLTAEDVFSISAGVTDLDSGHYHILTNASRFTTIGPVAVDSFAFNELIPNSLYTVSLYLRNDGSIATATNVTVEIETADTNVIDITHLPQSFGNIEPGQIEGSLVARIETQNNPNNINFSVYISSEERDFWSDSITVVLTGIADGEPNIPLEYALEQNYPNPFNPRTTIEFAIPKTGFVTLTIYDILGEKVATLISENLTAGSYKYQWETRGLVSGVYFYRIEATDFVKSRKMLLIR